MIKFTFNKHYRWLTVEIGDEKLYLEFIDYYKEFNLKPIYFERLYYDGPIWQFWLWRIVTVTYHPWQPWLPPAPK